MICSSLPLGARAPFPSLARLIGGAAHAAAPLFMCEAALRRGKGLGEEEVRREDFAHDALCGDRPDRHRGQTSLFLSGHSERTRACHVGFVGKAAELLAQLLAETERELRERFGSFAAGGVGDNF